MASRLSARVGSATTRPSVADLRSFFKQHDRHYLQWLEKLVKIGSYTNDPEGIAAQAKATAQMFGELESTRTNVVATARTIPAHCYPNGCHLVVQMGSSQHQNPSKRPRKILPKLGMVSHLDTVYPESVLERDNFRFIDNSSVDDRVIGPGTMDIKGGTVVMFMALHALAELCPAIFEEVDIRVLLDGQEEEMGPEFSALIEEELGDSSECTACLVYEAGAVSKGSKTSTIVTARKGRSVWKLHASGIEGHAGNAHKEGRNAIVELSRAILDINDVTDYSTNTTVNVGTIAGGKGVNSIPGRATALVEMRSSCLDSWNASIKKIESLCGGLAHPHVSIQNVLHLPPWVENDSSRWLAGVYADAAKSVGYDATTESRGGGSDGNWIYNKYPCIDGLGPCGFNAHCSNPEYPEHAMWSSFATKATISVLTILELLNRTP